MNRVGSHEQQLAFRLQRERVQPQIHRVGEQRVGYAAGAGDSEPRRHSGEQRHRLDLRRLAARDRRRREVEVLTR